jgi:GNAT superfamily N-acetyltransferase
MAVRPITAEEWVPLITRAVVERVASGLYTGAENDALLDPAQRENSWLPSGTDSTIVDLGVEVDGQIVGMLFVMRRSDGVGVLEALFVDPKYRDGGYARQLVQAGIAAVCAARLEMIEIFAMDREPRAITFWRHVLEAPPNKQGVCQLLDGSGGQLAATGWRLKAADVRV